MTTSPPDRAIDPLESLTVEQVARLLGKELTDCYYQLQTGAIPGRFKIGRSVRVQRRVLEEWIAGQVGSAR